MEIAGVVLAGGQSIRMGTDKANLTIEQTSLLMKAVNLLNASGIQSVYVSGEYEGYNSIPDIHSHLGPIAGIHASVSHLTKRYDAIFIVPVDMPLLTVKNCQHLLRTFKTTFVNQGVYYQDVIFPMILPLSCELDDYLQKIVLSTEKKHRSLYRLLKQLHVSPIAVNPQHLKHFENTNTPEEWQQCLNTFKQQR